MIAYHFPPEGNAGAHRPLRFVRQLPSQGWQPTVVTVKTDSYERYDPSLLSLVPQGIRIIGIRNRDPWQALQARRCQSVKELIGSSSTETVAQLHSAHRKPIRSFLRKAVRSVEACLYHPDIAMGWIRPAVKAITELCQHSVPDVIWATAGPVSSFVVAGKASKQTGVPYVLDFRDAWTIIPTEFDLLKPEWARCFEKRRMFRLLSGAQAVVFRYDTEAECFWRAYPGALDASRIFIIPNGYDGCIDQFTQPAGNKLNILYTGTLSDYRYDTLLQAIYLLKQDSPAIVEQLHLHFVGEGTEVLKNQSAVLGLADVISTSGPISHDAVTRISRQAHALLVLGRPATMKGFELFAAAKLFGYLKAGRPIIGILPTDEAKKILNTVGVSTVASIDSIAEISALLRKLIVEWTNGNLVSFIPNPTKCESYSADRQIDLLIRALDRKPAPYLFVPGRAEIPASLQKDVCEREWNGSQSFASKISVLSR